MRGCQTARVQVVALVLLGAAVFLPSLGQEKRLGSREDRHAEIAREMAETGRYAVPYLCGRPYIDKPPLFNWVVALLFRATGRTDLFVARLPSALCAIAAMVGIYVLGRRWLTARAGVLAAGIWATSALVVEWGRFCRMDMMLACLSLYAVVLADLTATAARAKTRAALWCGACALLGAATLAKGAIAPFFFIVALVALWRARRQRWLPPLGLIGLGAGMGLAVVGAWAAATEMSHPGHLRQLIGYQFGVGLREHPRWVGFYFDHLLLWTAPWGLFAPGAVYWVIRRVRQVGYDTAAIPALSLGVCMIVLSAATNKREHYLLPILPMWPLLLGGFVDWALRVRGQKEGPASSPEEALPRWAFDWPLLLCLLALATGGVLGAGFWVTLAGRGAAASVMVPAEVLAAVAALAVAGAAAAWRNRPSRATALLVLACAVATVAAYPLLARYGPGPEPEVAALQQAAAAIPGDAAVAACDLEYGYLYFKLNRPVLFAQRIEELRPFLSAPGLRCVVARTQDVPQVRGLSSRPLRVLGTWGLAHDSLTVLLAPEDEHRPAEQAGDPCKVAP